MTREDEELLLELSRISKDSGSFALGVLENNISRDDQIVFGYRLVDLAAAIRERALRTAELIIEGSVCDAGTASSTSSCSDLPTR
ncbi:MAG: hypothetical protein ACRDUV_13030 [Pseudonocardiaceae bacterium]